MTAPFCRLLVCWLMLVGCAMAQGPSPQTPLVLKPSSLLQERYDDLTRQQLPTFIQSDRMTGQTDLQTHMEGNVSIRRGGLLIRADQVDYDQTQDRVRAQGNVYLNRDGNTYLGERLNLQVDAFEGFFTRPQYRLLKSNLQGQAERVDFVDSGTTVLHRADLTSCQRKPGPNWVPDWFFKGEQITLDTDRNLGRAEGASLIFKGVPILPVPSVDFPLDDQRKSGFLPPTLGVDNIGGLEYTQPYYINLAPNRDLTLSPTYWSQRGLKLGGEFRYLENRGPPVPFQGALRFDVMPQDQLRDNQQRWNYQLAHTGLIQPGYAGGIVGLAMNLNRVSDQNYWKDFVSGTTLGVQRLLSNDLTTSWGNGRLTSALVLQRWQTLQDVNDPTNLLNSRITPPYDRVPQWTTQYVRNNAAAGLDFSVMGQVTRFEAVRDPVLDASKQPNCTLGNCNGERLVTQLQLSRPFTTPYGYMTPRIQAIGRQYQFDQPLANTGLSSTSVTTPTLSLDTGMVLERAQHVLGRDWVQTLEPRAFYVYTPYRAQNHLPNYDSGSNAYNFASIFTENAFGGYDRISDSRMLTLGATTRFIDAQTGAEGARFAIAQRLRMKPEQVVLNPQDTPPSAGLNNVLVGAGLNLTPAWGVESTLDYNPRTNLYQRRALAARYSPKPYRVLSAALRTSQNNADGLPDSRQTDVAWQWPLHDLWRASDEDLGSGRGLGEGRWYSVGRLNYSGLDRQFVESMVGFEYDAGCWLGRVVAERFAIADGVSRQRLLFQLEFVGFSRLGTNAIGSIRNNVPRYQPLRATPFTPSRFGHYD